MAAASVAHSKLRAVRSIWMTAHRRSPACCDRAILTRRCCTVRPLSDGPAVGSRLPICPSPPPPILPGAPPRFAGNREDVRAGAADESCIPPDRRLGEKSPQFVNEAARVVALDRVPCVLNPHPAAIGQCPREPLGVLVEEDVALC